MAYIAIAGDVHGALGAFYDRISKMQKAADAPIAAVFQVGDFQIYSKKSQIDKAVRKYGKGEFPQWFCDQRPAPVPTYVILGNHDDADLYYQYAGKEIVPSLHILRQGDVTSIETCGVTLNIGVLGGNYSSRYFEFKPSQLPRGRRRHYTKTHIESLAAKTPFDILLTHEAPLGFVFKHGQDIGRPEISGLISATKPRFAFFGHHHRCYAGMIGDTKIIGLPDANDEGGIALFEASELC
ncbi:MAG: metallophosphoesterase [Pseudomonadota bacterium]